MASPRVPTPGGALRPRRAATALHHLSHQCFRLLPAGPWGTRATGSSGEKTRSVCVCVCVRACACVRQRHTGPGLSPLGLWRVAEASWAPQHSSHLTATPREAP